MKYDVSYASHCKRSRSRIKNRGAPVVIETERGAILKDGYAIRGKVESDEITFINDIDEGTVFIVDTEVVNGDVLSFPKSGLYKGRRMIVHHAKSFSIDGIDSPGWRVIVGG